MAQADVNRTERTGTVTIPRAEYSRLVLESEALHMLKRVLGAFEARESEPNAPWAAQDQREGSSSEVNSSPPATAPQVVSSPTPAGPRRGIYIPALPPGTTLQELVSVVKGGAIISLHTVDMKRDSRTTTKGYLTLKSGSKEFLEWTQLNPIFLHGKKINFIWSNDKPTNKPAVDQAVAAGATRNIVIHGIGKKGITLAMLREDIGNLPVNGVNIINSIVRGDDAYLSNNSVWSAMRLREALLTHYNYVGCTASYYADECDRPLDSKPDILPAPVEVLPLLDLLSSHGRMKSLTNSAWAPILATASDIENQNLPGPRSRKPVSTIRTTTPMTDVSDDGVRIAMNPHAGYTALEHPW